MSFVEFASLYRWTVVFTEWKDIKRPTGKILWPAKSKRRENENPNLQQCLHVQYNAAALRAQKSIAIDPIHGNCGRKQWLYDDSQPDISTEPLRGHKYVYVCSVYKHVCISIEFINKVT